MKTNEALTQNEQRLVELLSDRNLWKTAKKFFDRSVTLTVVPQDDNTKAMHVRFTHTDAGQRWMTAADVAALASVDGRTVRRWCEARAQRESEHPIPFFRMYGMLRFERAKIEEWMKRQSDTPVVLPVQSGKNGNGRPRKTKLQ